MGIGTIQWFTAHADNTSSMLEVGRVMRHAHGHGHDHGAVGWPRSTRSSRWWRRAARVIIVGVALALAGTKAAHGLEQIAEGASLERMSLVLPALLDFHPVVLHVHTDRGIVDQLTAFCEEHLVEPQRCYVLHDALLDVVDLNGHGGDGGDERGRGRGSSSGSTDQLHRHDQSLGITAASPDGPCKWHGAAELPAFMIVKNILLAPRGQAASFHWAQDSPRHIAADICGFLQAATTPVDTLFKSESEGPSVTTAECITTLADAFTRSFRWINALTVCEDSESRDAITLTIGDAIVPPPVVTASENESLGARIAAVEELIASLTSQDPHEPDKVPKAESAVVKDMMDPDDRPGKAARSVPMDSAMDSSSAQHDAGVRESTGEELALDREENARRGVTTKQIAYREDQLNLLEEVGDTPAAEGSEQFVSTETIREGDDEIQREHVNEDRDVDGSELVREMESIVSEPESMVSLLEMRQEATESMKSVAPEESDQELELLHLTEAPPIADETTSTAVAVEVEPMPVDQPSLPNVGLLADAAPAGDSHVTDEQDDVGDIKDDSVDQDQLLLGEMLPHCEATKEDARVVIHDVLETTDQDSGGHQQNNLVAEAIEMETMEVAREEKKSDLLLHALGKEVRPSITADTRAGQPVNSLWDTITMVATFVSLLVAFYLALDLVMGSLPEMHQLVSVALSGAFHVVTHLKTWCGDLLNRSGVFVLLETLSHTTAPSAVVDTSRQEQPIWRMRWLRCVLFPLQLVAQRHIAFDKLVALQHRIQVRWNIHPLDLRPTHTDEVQRRHEQQALPDLAMEEIRPATPPLLPREQPLNCPPRVASIAVAAMCLRTGPYASYLLTKPKRRQLNSDPLPPVLGRLEELLRANSVTSIWDSIALSAKQHAAARRLQRAWQERRRMHQLSSEDLPPTEGASVRAIKRNNSDRIERFTGLALQQRQQESATSSTRTELLRRASASTA